MLKTYISVNQRPLLRFTEKNKNKKISVELNLPGIHNIQNALAAIAVATELDIDDKSIIEAFKNFSRN